MNAAAQRRLTVPLAAAAVVLGVLFLALLAGIGRGVHWAAPRRPAPLPAQHAATLPPPVPLQRYAAVWQQPLFNPDRKPVAHAASGTSQLGDMQLTGIILTPTLRMALLHNKRAKDSGKELRVKEGASLPDGSWTLVEVKPRAAVFDSSSGRVELQLPASAPVDQVRGGAGPGPGPGGVPAEASSIPEDVPIEMRRGHRLQPPPEDGEDEQDGIPQDEPGPGPGPGNPDDGGDEDDEGGMAPAGGGAISALRGGPARMDMTNDARQAERLRQLKAAIQKRRAEQAAAKAHQGDR
ncbi:general secretion pathway protein GspN [Frateuria sp. STR12]|uniref:general secretion pathway protein GspN n=1 Tax=Frateuria hangzhouensis TaxID=2995589 RepID=UPI002260DA0E|nr:general secretion pathway protein GspN [Frateuria sp. STR12]MCX7512644.1 general secretion pathway protein GspN [Frateuria sp. STR12]